MFRIEPKASNTNTLDIINTIMLSIGIYLVSAVLMPFFLFIIPAPSIVLSIKKGTKYGLLSMTLVCIVAYLFNRTAMNLTLLLYMIPIVIIMSSMIKEDESFGKIMGVNIFASLFITIVSLLTFRYILKVDILFEVNSFFTEMSKFMEEILLKSNFTETNMQQILKAYNFMKILLPGIVVLAATALNYGSFAFSKNLLKKQNIKISQNFKFIDYRISFKILLPTLFAVGVAYLLYYFKNPYFEIVLYNLVFIYSLFFILAGISLFDYYLVGKIPKILRLILPAVVLYLFRGEILYIAVATVDMLVNFRKRFKRIENEEK
ncbi:DUF2232 domain-containing protein [Miniphocaeibacter massiliensis]|uniref:DUF2232 domain-containing protein n=1 Tax=Miniphocaeibacter massiliensis TaxID=2041841 RepID=UPI000C07176C|nr:DUF2232 domain-containing protein [Miniphocaeibacter massiliensis]